MVKQPDLSAQPGSIQLKSNLLALLEQMPATC